MIGARLGRWVLDRELGRGGMGRVYLAHDADHPERRAAVKVLAADPAPNAAAVHRFRREIEVLGGLDHPNVVRFHESGTHEGLLYYVMEHVDGRDFAGLLAEHGRLPWPEVLDMAIQVCAALKHAHDRGVIHRDIKPSNLLRANRAEESPGAPALVKLTDFGIAHVFAGKHLTRTGAVVGTAEYLSPEQAQGKPATRRSDLYSLGCVLYTLLCGRTPFRGDSVIDLLHKHRYAQFDPPRKVVPELPHEIDDVVCQLLEKEPEDRPPDAGFLQRRLEAVRRKFERRGDRTADGIVSEATQPGDTGSEAEGVPEGRGEGPATLMSRLLRRELDEQNRGGPVRQFFNRPAVLVALFALCAGALAWTFWPADPEKLYEDGRALMESDEPDDWAAGWEKLQKVGARQPDGPHAAEIERYRHKIEDYRAGRLAAWRGERLSEAQWFYQQGLRRRQRGDAAGAKETWRNLVRSFRDVPAEQAWVRLAERELAKEDGAAADARRWDAVRAALGRARRLRDEGKPQEADEVCAALEELYRDDPSAKDILSEIRDQK